MDHITSGNSGIVYVASGDRFVREAEQSLISLKAVMPNVPAVLFTDFPEKVVGAFDQVIRMTEVHFSFLDKIYAMRHSPFERTLYVDTDVYFCRDCSHLFDALDRFDIAAAHEPSRNHQFMDRVPDYFPELNCGIILFRKTAAVETMLTDWDAAFRKLLQETGYDNDQLTFRELLYQSSLRFLALGAEYNFRAEYAVALSAWSPVWIIHARHVDFADVKRIAEQSYKPRVFMPHAGYLEPRYLATFEARTQWALYLLLRLTHRPLAFVGKMAERLGFKNKWTAKIRGHALPWPPK